MVQKLVSLNGCDYKIHGKSGDPYFDHLNIADHTNDYLIYSINRYINRNSIIFDVGANIGMTAAFLSSAASDGKVFAFEPDVEIYQHLLLTIEANQLANCQPFMIALGAEPGEVDFLANPDSGSASHLSLRGTTMGGANARVQVKQLDAVVSECGLDRLDFIKIDVEGFELDVLEGGKSSIARHKPMVFLEFNAFALIAFGNRNPRHVIEHLKRTFPHVYRFETGVQHEITDEGSVLGFIHDNLIKRGCVDDLLCTFEPLA